MSFSSARKFHPTDDCCLEFVFYSEYKCRLYHVTETLDLEFSLLP